MIGGARLLAGACRRFAPPGICTSQAPGDLPARGAALLALLYRLLVNKYYFDWFNENVLRAAARAAARQGLWRVGDER